MKTYEHSCEVQVSLAKVIVSMTNWVLVVLAVILFGLRVEDHALGAWISLAILSTEFTRIFRILRRVSGKVENNVIVRYFRGDSARKSFSVRDASEGVIASLS